MDEIISKNPDYLGYHCKKLMGVASYEISNENRHGHYNFNQYFTPFIPDSKLDWEYFYTNDKQYNPKRYIKNVKRTIKIMFESGVYSNHPNIRNYEFICKHPNYFTQRIVEFIPIPLVENITFNSIDWLTTCVDKTIWLILFQKKIKKYLQKCRNWNRRKNFIITLYSANIISTKNTKEHFTDVELVFSNLHREICSFL